MNDDTANRMRPTGWRAPVVTAVILVVLGYLVIDAGYSALPALPWTAIPPVLMLAGVELIAAVYIRRQVRGIAGAPLFHPSRAAWLVALAKASIGGGAVLTGAFTGFALAVVTRLHAPDPQVDFAVAVVSALSSALLWVAGAVLERCCRVPEDG